MLGKSGKKERHIYIPCYLRQARFLLVSNITGAHFKCGTKFHISSRNGHPNIHVLNKMFQNGKCDTHLVFESNATDC